MNTAHRKHIKRIGKRIKELRNASGVDQKQFAFECSVSRTQLFMIEKGETNPRIETLMKIADGLGVSLSSLLNE